MILSETFVVKDCIWIDKISAHNNKWWLTQTGMEQTVETDGILLNNPNSSSYSECWTYLTDSFPSSTSARNQAITCYNTPTVVEFDVISVSSTTDVRMLINDGTTSVNHSFNNYGITEPCHCRLEIDGSEVRCYINNATTPSSTRDYAIPITRFGFRVYYGQSLKYDNLLIYPI